MMVPGGRAARRDEPMRAPTPLFALMLAAAITGCGDSASADGDRAVVRDSAGIAIVENAGSAYDGMPVWTLGAEPVLRIGRIEGEAAYLFDGIRGVTRLTDGRIVVANNGSGTLRWYGEDGTFLFERGGQGGGPGEFERLAGLGRTAGDTIFAIDSRGRRIVLFTPDGELVATIVLRGFSLPPGAVYALADGSYIGGVGGFSTTQLGDKVVEGVQRFAEPIYRFSADGADVDTLGMFPGVEIDVQTRGQGFMFGPARFGKTLEYVAAGDRVYIGTGDRLVIAVHTPDGRLVRSIRVPGENLHLTPERIDAYKDRIRAGAVERNAAGPELERELAAMRVPETFPAYTALLLDAQGNLWAEQYAFDSDAPRRWAVFDPDGRLIGPVEAPARFRPLEIADGLVLGTLRDELDVESVAAYRIERE